jgi:hypothetical protein
LRLHGARGIGDADQSAVRNRDAVGVLGYEGFTAFMRAEWVVYSKRPFGGPKAVLAYLSRYAAKQQFRSRWVARKVWHPGMANPRAFQSCGMCGSPTPLRKRAERDENMLLGDLQLVRE